MLKRQSKVLSIALIFVFCMSFMVAGLVAPQVAQADVKYSALSQPYVSDNTPAVAGGGPGQALGAIQIDVDNCAAIRNGDVLTISFSSEVNLENTMPLLPSPLALNAGVWENGNGTVRVVFPTNIGSVPNALNGAAVAEASVAATRTTLDITFNAVTNSDAGRMLIYFDDTRLGAVEGDIVATIAGPGGGAFPMGTVTVAKALTDGDILATAKSVKTYGASGGMTDTIIIAELKQNSIAAANQAIKVRLPSGFSWVAVGDPNNPNPVDVLKSMMNGMYSWGFAAQARSAVVPPLAPLGVDNPAAPSGPNTGDLMLTEAFGGTALTVDNTDNRNLYVNMPAGSTTTSVTGPGQLRFHCWISVDDAVAKEGEVVATISDLNGVWSDKELTVMNYASYGAKVVEGTTKELIAGKHDQKLGSFFIEEGVGNSLLNNRTIKLVLPNGVKWSGSYQGAVNLPLPNRKEGNADLTNIQTPATFSSPYDIIKYRVTAGATKSKWEFKDFKVDIAPDFAGDLTIKVEGDAGVTGEVVVATVKPAVDLNAEIKNVRIGEQNQELGDLTITETKKENIALRTSQITVWPNATTATGGVIAATPVDGQLALTLPRGAQWAPGFPTVEVTEGDVQFKINDMSKVDDSRTILIPVKSEGMKPSTIKISGMKATIDRTVPEGDFKVTVTGTAINETGGAINWDLAFPQYEGLKVAVANCVTPAPVDGTEGAAAGQFKIDSNIYQLNGVAKVMDVAPYIKSGRTYVPVRYLGYALGVAEADVVWDEGSQKVTLTKGDNVVELTIGSTTITVNGEAQTMDVAPEITNGRTMLPARYVAEGLGYVVGWDPGTRTVLISK